MKKFLLMLLLSVQIFVIGACSSEDPRGEVSNCLGVEVSGGTIAQNTDSHGGFHGDGTTYLELTFDEDAAKALTAEIQNDGGWSELPLTEQLSIAVYGGAYGLNQFDALVKSEDDSPLFPKVEKGYYFFLDRNSEGKDEKDDSELFNRFSYNFTIAIFDTETLTMYYYELDT